mmetsp:Transcript_109460/g.275324  ORF Transcript_109460/g.275324 Transcript_109460/m.275324 type:complete len:242 (-) Transcript_109460:221-946(-)
MIRPALQLGSDDGVVLLEARRSQASSRSSSFDRQLSDHSTVSVKNTFIDGFIDDSDEEAEDALPMVATKSCPAVRTLASHCAPSAVKLTAGAPRGYLVQYQLSSRDLAPDTHAASLQPHDPMPQQHDAILAQHEQHPPVPSRPSAGPQVVTSGGDSQRIVAARVGSVMPLAIRQPEMSVGSVLHGAGQCKPCAWFWRPQGCENGAECRHCHLCGAGAIKARRKAKAASLRTKGAQGAAFTA